MNMNYFPKWNDNKKRSSLQTDRTMTFLASMVPTPFIHLGGEGQREGKGKGERDREGENAYVRLCAC